MKTFMLSCVAAVLLTTTAVAQEMRETTRDIMCVSYPLLHQALVDGRYKEDNIIPIGFIGTENRNIALVLYSNTTTGTFTVVEAHTRTRMGCVLTSGIIAK
jgi:hypothetical protein